MTPSLKNVLIITTTITLVSLVSVVPLSITSRSHLTRVSGHSKSSGASTVRIAVFNGCGRPGLASMFAETLRANGFDVVNGLGGNADSFDYDVSVVVTRKPNSRNKSVLVAESLGITRILEQYSDNQFIMEDVLVILGRDWDTLLTPKEENAD